MNANEALVASIWRMPLIAYAANSTTDNLIIQLPAEADKTPAIEKAVLQYLADDFAALKAFEGRPLTEAAVLEIRCILADIELRKRYQGPEHELWRVIAAALGVDWLAIEMHRQTGEAAVAGRPPAERN